MVWDKAEGDCNWVGFGFGWDGWRGKILGDIVYASALELYVKSVKGKVDPLNFVFLLEDYGENQVGVAMSNSFLEGGGTVDENWKKITVPLHLFKFDDNEVDAFNIKQLIIEVNGEGAVYIDDLKIVSHETLAEDISAPKPKKAASTPPIGSFLATEIYTDDVSDTWGLEQDGCKNFRPNTTIKHSGEQSLEFEWSSAGKGCSWIGMGIGWDSWEAKNLSKIMEKAAIQIHVRAPDGQTMYNLPIVALIEDYEGKQCGATFSFKYAGDFPITDKWQKMLLPLSDFNYDETPINQANVKQLILTVSYTHLTLPTNG